MNRAACHQNIKVYRLKVRNFRCRGIPVPFFLYDNQALAVGRAVNLPEADDIDARVEPKP